MEKNISHLYFFLSIHETLLKLFLITQRAMKDSPLRKTRKIR